MTAPGIVTGSNNSTLFRSGPTGTPTQQGAFGRNPGATPKFALNRGPRDAEYSETMARLFIALPPDEIQSFLNSVSPDARPLAQVLIAGGPTGGAGGTGFMDFLLTSAVEDFQEKAQIVDTLTDNYVAFYAGQVPPVFQYSGTVLNTYQDDQRVWLLRLYREILRGTRLANRNVVANLRYDSFLVTGYLESLRLTLDGDQGRTAGQFSFNMRVQRMSVLTPPLAAPTITTTPAVTSLVLGTLQTASATPDTERVAAVTPETPPTATEGPAADPQDPATPTDEDEAALQSQGLTTEQITQSYSQADAAAVADQQTQGPELQSREAEVMSSQAGTERVAATVQTTTTTTTPARTPAQRRRQAARSAGSTTAVTSVPQYDADGSIVAYSQQSPPVNPANMSSDGNGGRTNVYGPGDFRVAPEQPSGNLPSYLLLPQGPAPLTPRTGQRSRGRQHTGPVPTPGLFGS